MNYNGGKSYTIARHGMGDFWRATLPRVRRFVDAFAGSGAVSAFVSREFPGIRLVCNDAHPHAAALLRAAADLTWSPPPTIDEATYAALKARARAGDAHPDVAFAGFGASFGASFFSGFARPHPRQRDKAAASARSWERDRAALARAEVTEFDYADLPAAIGVEPGDLWYFDKPYGGTTGYPGMPRFDHARFWAWVGPFADRAASLVSEFEAPPPWVEAWGVERKLESRGGERRDRVFFRVGGEPVP